MKTDNALGELIRQRRAVKHYSQAELAEQLKRAQQNYAPSSVGAWENGRRPPVDDANIPSEL